MALGACGGSDAPPTCQDALTHYYSSGCDLYDLSPGSAVAFSEATAITDCVNLVETEPSECLGGVNDLIACFGSVPEPSTQNSQCDCSVEQTAVQECR